MWYSNINMNIYIYIIINYHTIRSSTLRILGFRATAGASGAAASWIAGSSWSPVTGHRPHAIEMDDWGTPMTWETSMWIYEMDGKRYTYILNIDRFDSEDTVFVGASKDIWESHEWDIPIYCIRIAKHIINNNFENEIMICHKMLSI